MSGADDPKNLSLTQLFRMEAEGQLAVLTAGLLALEQNDASHLEELMRAAHSLKGAARIIGANAAVHVAHAMEDCFVAAQQGSIILGQPHIDRLLVGVDLLGQISRTSEAELPAWDGVRAPEIDAFLAGLKAALAAKPMTPVTPMAAPARAVPGSVPAASGAGIGQNTPPVEVRAIEPSATRAPMPMSEAAPAKSDARVLRVTADHLNRLLALAGESLVESRRLQPFGVAVGRLKRLHQNLSHAVEQMREQLETGAGRSALAGSIGVVQQELGQCREFLAERMLELDAHDRRSTNLAHRLYREALAVRMRPFADGIGGFPRMVRDVARQLGKEVALDVEGEDTQVDRDILAQLEAPLGHLLRNAVDHGIEPPEVRKAAGKPAVGRISLEARHSAGVLLVTVGDDGYGLAPEVIRAAVVRKELVSADVAPRLSESELFEFLFLPGFSLREQVTEISGRGVGLDAVQTMVKSVRGHIRVLGQPGRGLRFQLQLPLTLSVVRALLVDIAGEPYAIPLGFIARTLRMPLSEVAATEGKQHFELQGRRIGLVGAHQVLGRPGGPRSETLAVVVLGEGDQRYGVVVDEFRGERELVVQPLDSRLGKVKDIAAGALMEDGSPVLIIDVADFVRSVEKIAGAGQLGAVRTEAAARAATTKKRVLVVDDSLTVRELERKLLDARGYSVEVAVDGMDGWNAVRTGGFALIITDVDMPRLDGIELTRLIKNDTKLRTLPVMIVSYKDREDDRRRGLEAGADYYLTKGSFHDETMLNAVTDLIGPAEEASV